MIASYDTIICMNPPFKITPNILKSVTDISLLLGKYEGLQFPIPTISLRRENKIRTIYSSLVIEGNNLSKEQVTALLDGKPVIGKKKDIQEVQNAIKAYDLFSTYKPHSLKSFLSAHKVMLEHLVDDAGKIRTANVGIFNGSKVAHVAPKYTFVPKLMDDLFSFVKRNKDINILILSSIFHYEVEFIHPFKDGNGRMGRLWQSVMLYNWNPLFEFLPIESLIRQSQKEYYKVLGVCDKSGESTLFIEFMLDIILQTLSEFMEFIKPQPLNATGRLELFKTQRGESSFSRKDYLSFFKTISTATASRDLSNGVAKKIITKEGNQNTSVYKF
ncbi:cell filamentation protein Fic [Candidatus Marinamargulisbacteria bacterium SCGC AAA071-K20]|nr:cell filamentation protein Fic [Candidatus Marinamargulisbacteria bacterium SCGC AAA071-K20]